MDFDFKAVVDDIEAVPEEFRELYEEGKEGNHVLKTSVLAGHPALVNVKATADKLDRQKRELEKRVTDMEAKLKVLPEDFDPELYERAKHEAENPSDDPKKKVDADKDVASVRKMLEQKLANSEKALQQEIAQRDEKIAAKDAYLQKVLIDDGLTKALIEAGVSKEYLRAAKALLREGVNLIEEDGQYRAVVETDIGETELPKFVADWVASDEGKPFVPAARGADAKGSNGARAPEPNPWKSDSFNLTAQGQLISQDRAKAERLMKAAGLPDSKIRAYVGG